MDYKCQWMDYPIIINGYLADSMLYRAFMITLLPLNVNISAAVLYIHYPYSSLKQIVRGTGSKSPDG